jgi:hypothetical protein
MPEKWVAATEDGLIIGEGSTIKELLEEVLSHSEIDDEVRVDIMRLEDANS